MKFTRPDLAALGGVVVVAVAAAACAIARVDVPGILTELGLLLAGIAGGAALPGQSSTAGAAPAPLPQEPAPAADLPPVTVSAPAALFAEPQTGTFARIARHEP